jgi:mono/diheme cytochrome c family protein
LSFARYIRLRAVLAAGVGTIAGAAIGAHLLWAQSPQDSQKALESSFDQTVKPFFQKNCQGCHNSDLGTAGVRVDQLDASMDDRQVKTWEAIRGRLKAGTMPPKGMPQPSAGDRESVAAWITRALEMARVRPAPKNGVVRRLTVAQYRNTVRELLGIEDDVSSGLPPDALSKDGFLNNKDQLQLSPLLTEAYFEIAEDALNRAIVDPRKKPVIEHFRMDLGARVNPAPLPERPILGPDSDLLESSDVLVTEPVLKKPFAFEPFHMPTHFRFIEGYRGNDTVRGWREFDSIYHAVFADMRGSPGYPKGKAYSTAPEGLLLRPVIPSVGFQGDSAMGPKANFNIPVRALPNTGRFRVTVVAAKYRDGLLLDPEAKERPVSSDAILVQNPQSPQTVTIPKSGIYQVDIRQESGASLADPSRLNEGLTGVWPKDGTDSPVGKALSLKPDQDGLAVSRKSLPADDAHALGEGDFSIAAWIHPGKVPGRRGILSLGNAAHSQGWFLEMETNPRSVVVRYQTAGRDRQANATLTPPRGAIRADGWLHVAVVVRRGQNDTRLYVNGALVSWAATGQGQFDDEEDAGGTGHIGRGDLQIGQKLGDSGLEAELADVRLYCRPLQEAEILALVQPGKNLITAPQEQKGDVTLQLGNRQFSGVRNPAFLVARLEQGPLAVKASSSGVRPLERVLLTPLSPDDDLARKFAAFEKRSPRVGVHLGLRRDDGATLAQVGVPQTVSSEEPSKYVFEGAIRNFPSTDSDRDDNVNYLQGLHEIAVRSEYTDGRDMPRLAVRSVEFEGPYYDSWPPASHTKIFVPRDPNTDEKAYASKIIRNFATRAWRRPLTSEEDAELSGIYEKSMAASRPFQDSVKDALLVVLTSPQFLFLTEVSKSPAPEPLGSYELASKLSYWLWNGPPDHKTLQLAAAGTLRQSLNAEVVRMVADPRFSRFVNEFAAQWLTLDKFQVLEVDRNKYPKLTRDVRAQLKEEPAEFLQYLIRNNLPAKNIIASDFMLANETTAGYYGLANSPETGFTFVPVRHDRTDLGGVLTMAATMAGLSDGREANPVKRGAWVARKIVAEPPNDPPPNVPPLKEETKDLPLRERLQQHRSAPACAQCHSRIDPWGIALEQFDAGGRLKQTAADARSTLPDGTNVASIEDLKRYLGEDRIDQVAFSLLKHVEIYAAGRSLTYNELSDLKQDALKLKPAGYGMRDMLLYVANSKVFLEK